MPFKQLSLAMLAAVASQVALAEPATGLIQFKGLARYKTCAVSVGGVDSSNTATVFLPDISTRDLPRPGVIAGITNFTIDLKNCFYARYWPMKIFLRAAAGNDVTDGRLDNMATDSPARNVQLQFWNEGGYFVKVGYPGQESYVDYDYVYISSDHTGKVSYSVMYYGFDTVTQGGNVEAAVEYLIEYL